MIMIIIIKILQDTMTIEQPFSPHSVDTAIIGAGPHALTLAAHLLQKSKKFHQKFLVFDASADWLSQWNYQFNAFQIPHLRSPVVHHPESNAFALRAFAEKRQAELFEPYDLPGTQLFQEFCAEVVHRWQLAANGVPIISYAFRNIAAGLSTTSQRRPIDQSAPGSFGSSGWHFLLATMGDRSPT
jgi:FAD-NAD(P)-binding